MKFFMNKHYSTALKIIDEVENKLAANLLKHPMIVEKKQLDKFADVIIDLNDKRKLAETLGDLLKDKLPNSLYSKYQQLDQAKKQKIRHEVATNYFNAIKNFSANLQTLDLDVDMHKYSRDYDATIEATIFLPALFNDKMQLSAQLNHSLTLFQNELLNCENDLVKFKNAWL